MKILIALMFLVFGSSSFAAEKAVPAKKVEEAKVEAPEDVAPTGPQIIKKQDYILEDSSRHNRMGKNYAAWAQLVGIGPSLSSSSGLAFGYYYTSEDIFFVEATNGSSNTTWSGFIDSKLEVDTGSFGVHWKRFMGNSFYLNTGVDFRKVDYKYSSVSSSTTSSFDATSTAISFAIGNQWQWQNFTLGCDWVGISVPFAHDISDAKITTGSTYEEDDFKRDQEELVKDSHLQLLRFYLGASF